ncbi:MAG: acetyl-CoA carboxylase, carboxyltransferase subunit beta [Fimbriimonadaceae bacterium]
MLFSKGSKNAADGSFVHCANCKKLLFAEEFAENYWVCTHCQHHHRITAQQRIDITFDPGSFDELDADLSSTDFLKFPDYAEKLESANSRFGLNDGMVAGKATIDGMPVFLAISDFRFMGGSMGSVAGEKVTRTLERAANEGVPALIFCASGGARMQEGLTSLMQMAKTTAAAQRCAEQGVPYIVVYTDPTMAGVLASYASVADIAIAEPKALIGFAGARVSKQAGVGKVPDGFQTSEYLLEHGMLDKVVPRSEIRPTLTRMLRVLTGGAVAR